jgi:hypothetical protein
MQLTGKGTLSLEKGRVIDSSERMLDYGYRKITFAHQSSAAGGDDHIPLDSLQFPTGFQAQIQENPSAQFLLGMNLREFCHNMTLYSTARGTLIPDISYWCSNTKIHFNGFITQPNEIFYGVINHVTRPNTVFVDAVPINISRTLSLGQTTFVIGDPFRVNAFENESSGAVKVYVDGELKYRNTNNSDTTLDRDYYEVPTTEGLGISIEFNSPFGSDVEVTVVSNYAYVDRPNHSLLHRFDILATQLESIATQTGSSLDLSDFPNTFDIKAFGDRLLNAEQWLNSQGKVGDTISSFLTELQFQNERDGTWILADGRSITGSDLATLTGWTNAPDLRGVFLRGKDNGAGVNPDGDLALGTYTDDKFESHSHVQSNINNTNQPGSTSATSGTRYSATGNYSTASTGGNETAPKSVTVNHFIKINY